MRTQHVVPLRGARAMRIRSPRQRAGGGRAGGAYMINQLLKNFILSEQLRSVQSMLRWAVSSSGFPGERAHPSSAALDTPLSWLRSVPKRRALAALRLALCAWRRKRDRSAVARAEQVRSSAWKMLIEVTIERM
jgi:hypothetical protein